MKRTRVRSNFHFHHPLIVLSCIMLVLIVLTTACNYSFVPSADEGSADQGEFSDENARDYLMYYDSSADQEQNELQVRRFKGHIHLANIADIFGDPQELELDENCNYAGGPILAEGLIWYVSLTTDLVGANLISVSPDGTMSSTFDLDGDRVADIVDIRLGDNRRISILTEQLGLDTFELGLLGWDPFCETELARQLNLPSLGCNENGGGSSGGGGGGAAADAGIIDPFDMICSEYDTSPRSGIMARNPARTQTTSVRHEDVYSSGRGFRRNVKTYIVYDSETGEHLYTRKVIIDTYWRSDPPRITQVIDETVYPDGSGHRETTRLAPNGSYTSEEEDFEAKFYTKDDLYGQDTTDYDETESEPPIERPPTPPTDGATEGNPGPEGDDTALAEFCRNRANYQSGVEQATSTDPSSMRVTCEDLVASSSGDDCVIIEWARPEDFQDALQPSSDNGCGPFEQPGEDGFCEPTSIKERLRGLTAELLSADLEGIVICDPIVCNPGPDAQMRTYTSGEIEPPACPVIAGPPALEPSEANCPAGTYYAPATNQCIEIQLPSAGDGGGRDGGGAACNLSVAKCSSQGLSFDSNNCECEPIQ